MTTIILVFSCCLSLLAINPANGCEEGNPAMLKLKVKYFLSQEGLKYFPVWFNEVVEVSSQQDGFCGMSYDNEGDQPVVTLNFENQEKLLKWASTDLHDELANQLEAYFIKPQDVETQ